MTQNANDKPIQFIIASQEDVTMLSAFLQDALIAPHDIHYDKARHEVVMVADRYRRSRALIVMSAFLWGSRIGKVRALLQKNMAKPNDNAPSLFYNLLQVSYEQEQDGTNALFLHFQPVQHYALS